MWRSTWGETPARPAAAATDSVLLLWTTDPHLEAALEVVGAWGFAFKTVGFYWIKTGADGAPSRGMGYWTRANPEACLLGVRGAVGRLVLGRLGPFSLMVSLLASNTGFVVASGAGCAA